MKTYLCKEFNEEFLVSASTLEKAQEHAEEYGGVDFGMVGLGCILEETGRKLVPSPLFSTALVGASILAIAGNDKQKKEFLPKVAEGKLITAFALEESGKHDPLNISTSCIDRGNKLVLEGKKTFVLDRTS